MQKSELKQEREQDLAYFVTLIESLSDFYKVEKIAEYIYVIHQKDVAEEVNFTFMGLTHGNEVAGFFILLEFISYLKKLRPNLPFSLGLALGNVEAFKKNQRFLECDLNRSFSISNGKLLEQRRAAELSSLLSRTRFLLDFHQTQQPCHTPFFIFPYLKKSLRLAATLSREIPIVTHWGASFSKDGMCTDEFVNSQGGTGISVETGGSGSDPLQIAFGLHLILKALFLKEGILNLDTISPTKDFSYENLSIYSWNLIYPYPQKTKVLLKEGLWNFSLVKKGQILGLHEGAEIKSAESGYLLFPKYIKENEKKPKELFRLITKIAPNDLPESL